MSDDDIFNGNTADDESGVGETVELEKMFCHGKYVVVGQLGEGGMGEVWLCRDRVGGINVALKKVPEKYAVNERIMAQIRKNFQIVEKLHHPHIGAVKTMECEESTGEYLLIMEYIPGQDLAGVLRSNGGPLEIERVVQYAAQAADALDYGHSFGIIHRDIKPENVMISEETGKVKILDYGIAAECVPDAETLTLRDMGGDSDETANVGISGSPPFMSPEQWTPKSQGPRTDQYSLAATVYCLLNGKHAFADKGGGRMGLRDAVMNDPRPAIAGVDKRVSAVVQKAMSIERKNRYGSCTEFAEKLADAAGVTLDPIRRRSQHLVRRISLVASMVVIALLCVTAYLMSHPPEGDGGTVLVISDDQVNTVAGMSYQALVIGVDEYRQGWSPLSNAVKDAGDFADLIESNYQFEVVRLFNEEATRERIMLELQRISNDMGTEDNVLIYFAGHGDTIDELKEGFWIPYDATPKSNTGNVNRSWIPNWMVTRFLEASRARHILVIADSCYSGSIFTTRGNVNDQSIEDLIGNASRYVIASGDARDRVLDGTGGNSPFNEVLMDYMKTVDKPIFSASELAHSIENPYFKKSNIHLTKGPLFRDSGGQFVFVKKGTVAPAAVELAASGHPDQLVGDSATNAIPVLVEMGYTNIAQRLMSKFITVNPETVVPVAVANYLDYKQAAEKRAELNNLIEFVAEHERQLDPAVAAALETFGRPRILTVLGPEDAIGSEQSRIAALRFRNALEGALSKLGGFRVVDRKNLQEALQELQLEAGLTDQRIANQLGAVLPATLMLTGELTADEQGWYITLRLLETKSTALLAQFDARITDDQGVAVESARLAKELKAVAVKERPLRAKLQASQVEGELLGLLGKFHGVTEDMQFDVIKQVKIKSVLFDEVRDTKIGSATIKTLGENTLDIAWDLPADTDLKDIWIKEVP